MVASAPVQKRVVARGGGVEMVGASHGHDPRVMLDEGFSNAACA